MHRKENNIQIALARLINFGKNGDFFIIDEKVSDKWLPFKTVFPEYICSVTIEREASIVTGDQRHVCVTAMIFDFMSVQRNEIRPVSQRGDTNYSDYLVRSMRFIYVQ